MSIGNMAVDDMSTVPGQSDTAWWRSVHLYMHVLLERVYIVSRSQREEDVVLEDDLSNYTPG